jgi:hypothetical protein
MMAILTSDRRGQAQNKPRLHLTDDLLEAAGRQVVTFIDDHLPVFSDTVVDDILRTRL